MAILPFSPFLAVSPSLYPAPISSYQIFAFRKPHLCNCSTYSISRTRFLSFALAESDSSKSLSEEEGEPILPLLQELSDCLILPPDFLSSLPKDLRLDLNDAAFDLSNGPVLDDCGGEVGEILLNFSRAWESADTSTSNSLAKKLPSIKDSLKGNAKPALGKRLVSAGRRFQSMGQYGQGELERAAKSMIKVGKVFSRGRVVVNTEDSDANKQRRKLKFGQIEFELTREKAILGAVVSFLFGILSGALTQGVQNMPENSVQYANDNAASLATSLRGALLVLCYSSTILSAATAIGLVVLGSQLNSDSKSK